MSSKKRQPFRSLPHLPATPRWAPSTPHATRASQQRSIGRRKSTNINRPESARNILRQLAKLTAHAKRRTSTPHIKTSPPLDKENASTPFLSEGDEEFEGEEVLERPDFTLPIEELDEDDDAEVAPTQQELPGGEDYTFKSIDCAAQEARLPTSSRSDRIRQTPRISILAFPDDEDGGGSDHEGDLTVESIEYGRRAVSEGPTGDRYPRSSFGSIRMSEFGLEESRLGKEWEAERSLIIEDQHGDLSLELDDAIVFAEEDEPENSRHDQELACDPANEELFVPVPDFLEDENTFRLDFGRDQARSGSEGPSIKARDDDDAFRAADAEPSAAFQPSPTPPPQSPSEHTRQITIIEAAAPSRAHRRKKLKLTRQGNTVPALPSTLVKRMAIDSMTRTGRKKPVISREHLAALEQATEWFFEQVGEDLEAYSNHAKRRKRIDDADVITLMKRQRVIGRGQSLEDLAEEFLPNDVFLNLNLPKRGE